MAQKTTTPTYKFNIGDKVRVSHEACWDDLRDDLREIIGSFDHMIVTSRCADSWTSGPIYTVRAVRGDRTAGGANLHEDQIVALDLASPDPVQMAVMLEACRNQFAYYARQHDAKGTAEGKAKADANRLYVARIEQVLAGGKAGS